MSDPGKAVFLSYASQDAEAARKICEALRAAGVEVWFDQSELVGGDAWDQKIRKQIKECALFVPVISAATQARAEGYFRREWKLAVERTHDMADHVTFLVPVVIDDTRDREAHVPEAFLKVQWTRLRGGETPPAFADRVRKLLGGEMETRHSRPVQRDGDVAPPLGKSRPTRSWLGLAIIGVVAVVMLAVWRPWRPSTAIAANAPANPDDASQLVPQARELIYNPDSARNEFALAESLLKRATDLAPTSGAAWGASALLSHYFYSRAYDTSRTRLVRSQAEAEKALQLEPRNVDALLALGLHRQVLGESNRAQGYLDQARAADPQNFKVILAQSLQLTDRAARVKLLLDAAAHNPRPAELFYYASGELSFLRRMDESTAACERAIQAQPFWRTFVQGAANEEAQTADPVRITAWLNRVPELKRDEPRVAFLRFEAARLGRDGSAAVRALTGLAVDYLEDNFFTGPKAYLLAQAYELAGQPERAAEQWLLAERTVREKLVADPGAMPWRAMLAVTLAGQHRIVEAKAAAEACAGDDRIKLDLNVLAIEETANAFCRLGDAPRAIALLRTLAHFTVDYGFVSAATLAVDPRWDPLRGQPGFAELVAEMKRAENRGADGPAAAVAVPTSSPRSVAVLAFTNLSEDKDNRYFSESVSEELLNVLAQIPGLNVAGRT